MEYSKVQLQETLLLSSGCRLLPPRKRSLSLAFPLPDRETYSVGNLRFTPPQPPLSFSGVHQASGFGASCPQQTGPPLVIAGINVSSLLPSSPQSEDCKISEG